MELRRAKRSTSLAGPHRWDLKLVRRGGLAISTLIISVAALWLILISPFFLREIGRIKGINWTDLANIGQTYGAASAILSAIALIGIALSLTLQARQARTERIRLVRDRRIQLLEAVLDQPEIYGPVIGVSKEMTADEARQSLFAAMWVDYSRMGYELGILTEPMLRREIFPAMFKSEIGRAWWETASHIWTKDQMLTRRDRQFIKIVSDEYNSAVAQTGKPHAKDTVRPAREVTASARSWRVPIGIALGAVMGFAASSSYRSITRRHGMGRDS